MFTVIKPLEIKSVSVERFNSTDGSNVILVETTGSSAVEFVRIIFLCYAPARTVGDTLNSKNVVEWVVPTMSTQLHSDLVCNIPADAPSGALTVEVVDEFGQSLSSVGHFDNPYNVVVTAFCSPNGRFSGRWLRCGTDNCRYATHERARGVHIPRKPLFWHGGCLLIKLYARLRVRGSYSEFQLL